MIRTPCRCETAKTETFNNSHPCFVSFKEHIFYESIRSSAAHSTSFDWSECLYEAFRRKMLGFGHKYCGQVA